MAHTSVPDGRGQPAIAVEQLLTWVYAVQRADMVLGWDRPRDLDWDAMRLLSGGGDSCARAGSIRVDGGRIRGLADDVHPDAELVHALVGQCQSHIRALITECARQREVPRWYPHVFVRIEPVPGKRGASKKLLNRHGDIIGCAVQEVVYQPVDLTVGRVGGCRQLRVSWPLVVQARDDYGSWWRALAWISGQLSGRGGVLMIDHRVLPMPASPTSPWFGLSGAN